MLEDLYCEAAVRCLAHVCQVVWRSGEAQKHCQTVLIIKIFTKGDRRKCPENRCLSQLSFPGKVFAECLENRSLKLIEPKLEDTQ